MADWIKLAGAGALALLLATPALADWHEEWDTDADGMLSEEEFGAGIGEAGVYDSYDADADGMVTEEEFNSGIFDGYDDDESGVIEEPELGDVGDDMGDGGLFDV